MENITRFHCDNNHDFCIPDYEGMDDAEEILCPICGEEWTSEDRRTIYCSDEYKQLQDEKEMLKNEVIHLDNKIDQLKQNQADCIEMLEEFIKDSDCECSYADDEVKMSLIKCNKCKAEQLIQRLEEETDD